MAVDAGRSNSSSDAVERRETKKSLMVVPFEDMSPTQDNGWLADGLTADLISALSKIRSLRVVDLQTSMDAKGLLGKTMFIAQEMDVRYFLEGHIRKFGDQIKLSASLLDVEEGEHLWQDSHRGEFKDIFTIQAELVRRAVYGLRLSLTLEEELKLSERVTENTEAYECYRKAVESGTRQSHSGCLQAIALFSEAIALDPGYLMAYTAEALEFVNLYRSHDRMPEYLVKAEELAKEALRLKPDFWHASLAMSMLYQQQGRVREAELAAMDVVHHAPDDPTSYDALGLFYLSIGEPRKAIRPLQQSLYLKSSQWYVYLNLVVACDRADEREEAEYWARQGLPHFETRLKLAPDHTRARIQYANLLRHAGRIEEARAILIEMSDRRDLDSSMYYDIACLQTDFGDFTSAIMSLRRAIDAGFVQVELLQSDIDLNPLRGLSEFQAFLADVEASGQRLAV